MSSDLNRFVDAQVNFYESARQEILNSKKTSHWMWFIFPQIKGLGRSDIARKYEIEDRKEAELYLEHDLLSTRLLDLTEILVNDSSGKTAEDIFGYPDYLKFHSCLTLFSLAVREMKDTSASERFSVFQKALDKFYAGHLDEETVVRL